MPNRILREGILTSDRVNALGAGRAELFYRRLMSVVDDFGRFPADERLLRSSCYPLRLDSVHEEDIRGYLKKTADAGLIRLYCIGSKRYLEMLDFRQQIRSQKSKYPACPAGAQQMPSTCAASAPVSVSVDEGAVEDVGVSEDGGGNADGKASALQPPTVTVTAQQHLNNYEAVVKALWPKGMPTVVEAGRISGKRQSQRQVDLGILNDWTMTAERKGSEAIAALLAHASEVGRSKTGRNRMAMLTARLKK